MKTTRMVLIVILFLLVVFTESYSRRTVGVFDEKQYPSNVFSPVIGDLEVIRPPEKRCTDIKKWCFNQHQSRVSDDPTSLYYNVGHIPGGGINNIDDTYAWDANLNTPEHDSDKEKPVYAVAKGTVAETFAGAPNAGGNYGQVLIEHKSGNITWWSGYLHLRNIKVKVGQDVNETTFLGYISDVGADNNHLHFAVYKGINTRGGLVSFDAKIIPRLTVPQPATAIAVIVDRSGSMEGEKIAKAKSAADGFFSGLTPSDYSCLVTFESDARTEVGLLQATPGNKIMLQAVAGKVEAGGSTNIGSGLTHGFIQLSAANALTSKTALLMSDGQHNTGELWPAVKLFEDKDWPIYTVAYGADADQATLAEIARKTGGTFFPAGLPNIAQVYHKISAHMHRQSVLFSYNDLISQGKELNYQVSIDPDIQSTTFFADWQGSTVELHLITPDGKEINPNNFSTVSGVTYEQGPTYCFYRVQNPKAGNWKAKLIGKLIEKAKEQVNFTVSGGSPFLTNILGFQPEYKVKEHIGILVKVSSLFEGDQGLLRDIKVTAEIKKPSPKLLEKEAGDRIRINIVEALLYPLFKIQRLKLHDDGKHGDLQAQDGVFTNIYKDADTNGLYVVTLVIEAKRANGEKVSRTLRESIQIGPIEETKITLADFLRIGR